jgi:hypothetical protein
MLLYQEGCYIDYQQSLMRPLELLPVEVSIKLPIQHFRRAHCGGPRGELDKLSRCLRSKSYFLHQLVGAAVTLLPSCHCADYRTFYLATWLTVSVVYSLLAFS